jgi:mannose-1-phosphate guanylyltransferase/mannose-6-phosphate isomerase
VPERVVTVTAASQVVLVRRQLAAIDAALTRHVLAEPSARNTAAAVALSALHAMEAFGPDCVLWVCPSDHIMQQPEALIAAVRTGLPAADAGQIVTFGITPSRPETGFGWIAAGEPTEWAGVLAVREFVEKPPPALAAELLAGGRHTWNSGMFLMRASSVLDELARFEPELHAAASAAFAQRPADAAVDAALYALVKSMPIDKAVMERSGSVAVVPCDPGWSDVGSWQALWELMDKDADGNAIQGDAIVVGASDNLVRSEKRLVALAGVRDLAVVETADSVLVARRDMGEAIRGVVESLGRSERKEAVSHAREVRPWGTFLVLQEGPRFKAKEVTVDPGCRLTLQYHPGRDEHWIVVAGMAEVELDGTHHQVKAGDSLRIARGQRHRLGNPGPAALRLIEIGYGDALGDEDTVRLEG